MGARAARFPSATIVVALASLAAGCMPASWGAGALLHPYRRHVTMARPADAEDLEIGGAGARLRGWKFRHSGPARGTVVYLHGSADNRTSGLFVADRFTPRGYDVIVYDSRAHGESEGEACTHGYHEKQRTVATERAPGIATEEDIEAAFRLAETLAHFQVDDVSPVASARQIAVPVLLVHGQDDRETSAAHSQRVFAALPGPKRLMLVPGAGHNDALHADVWSAIEAWIDEACPPR
jgi:uncharacterized protein